MNSINLSPNSRQVDSGFSTLEKMRDDHSELLERSQDAEEYGTTDQFLPEIEAFLYRGQATGVFLDRGDDRRAAQGLLDYWRAILYRWGHKPSDATLADFDLSLAPELDDSLCPYRGLEAFQEDNHKVFYGRQRLLDELLQKLTESRLLAVVGSSGSGKSSVVLGGLIPSLKAGELPGSKNWHYHGSMVPGSNPLENLARLFCPECDEKSGSIEQKAQKFIENSSCLAELLKHTDNQPSVLVIDQFEEMFTLCLDEVKRQAFIGNLLEVIQFSDISHRVVLTMSSEFEDRVAKFSAFDSLFKKGRVQVLSLGADELREAIEKPANDKSVGLKFEEGVVNKLIQDVLGEDSALPLLQFTLLKLWGERERNRISMKAYIKLQGGRLALSNSADEFYAGLIPEEQVTCKRIFLKMVRPTEGLEFTSSRILRRELYQAEVDRERVEKVLNKLIVARLVKFTKGDMSKDTQVEVAHEALIRNWPLLVQWLEDERVNLRQRYLHLTAAAQRWEEKDRDPSILLRDSELKDAQKYDDLNKLEAEFIAASVKAEKRLKEQEEERKERELSLIKEKLAQEKIAREAEQKALEQEKIATDEARKAKERELNLIKEKLAQEKIAREAEQKALEQEKIATDEARKALEQEKKASKVSQRLFYGTTIASILLLILGIFALSLWRKADNAKEVAKKQENFAIQQTNLAKQQQMIAQEQTKEAEQQRKIAEKRQKIAQAQTNLAEQQQMIAQEQTKEAEQQQMIAQEQRRIAQKQQWEAEKQKRIVQEQSQKIQKIQNQLLQRETGKRQIAQDAAIKERIRGNAAEVQNKLSSSEPPVQGLILSIKTAEDCLKNQKLCQPDQAVYKNVKNALKKAVQEAREQNVFAPKPIKVILFAIFSKDGQSIFSGDGQGIFQSWNLQDKSSNSLTCNDTNTPAAEGDKNNINAIAISPDGQLIVSGRKDGTIWLCSHDNSSPRQLNEPGSAIRAIAISPDGQLIVSGSEDGQITIWNSQGKILVPPFQAHGGKPVLSLAINQDQNIVSGGADRTLKLWKIQDKSIEDGNPFIGHAGEINSVAFNRDGSLIVSGSGDGTIRIWDRQGKELAKSQGVDLPGRFLSVVFSDDGTMLASGSSNKTIRLWQWHQGENAIKPIESLSPLKGNGGKINSVAFSANGQMLISGSGDGTIRLWDIQNQSNFENKDLKDLLQIACDRLQNHRSLTKEAKQTCKSIE